MDWFVAEDHGVGLIVLRRGVAALYLVAFLVARNQGRPLLGSQGLLPIPDFVRAVPFRRSPSLFHWRYSDRLFESVAWTGVVLAAVTVAGGTNALPLPLSMLVWLTLWLLYLSVVNVGQRWYGFGWESLLLEVGFLCVFLGNARTAAPWPVLLAAWWVLFRLEFGAGLIKLRGDRCWRDLTCLDYHHETQPMPGPLSWWFHHLPRPVHRVEVAANHVTQLVLPFGLFAPQPVAGACGAVMVVTQLWLVVSGNFAWLNWMAVVLGLSVLPDGFWHAVLPAAVGPGSHGGGDLPTWWVVACCAVVLLVALLSVRPVRTLLSPRQAMNASYDPLHLVNTYGAFGSVTRHRFEVVVEGTHDERPGPSSTWLEYEFKGKPGDVRRRPRQFAPYHLRLDWLMWFAALSPAYAQPWFGRFLRALVDGDRDVLRLLRHDPFAGDPPRVVRARLYRYRFTTLRERRATGDWWHRELVGDFSAPVSRTAGARRGPAAAPRPRG